MGNSKARHQRARPAPERVDDVRRKAEELEERAEEAERRAAELRRRAAAQRRRAAKLGGNAPTPAPVAGDSPPPAPDSRLLSRTLSKARWREYRSLLELARGLGYEITSLEEAVLRPRLQADRPVLLLRHDVDQHPRSVRIMSAIEQEAGVRSTWYFRWRTASQIVISELRQLGFDVGLHYETLSRIGRERGVAPGDDLSRLIEEARRVLREEVACFARLHGPIRSIAAHGDSSVPWFPNRVLLADEDPADYGVAFDANEAMRGRALGFWLTDRVRGEGGWANHADVRELLRLRVSPIMCLTHPNNWASGPSLWLDRIWRTVLPAAGAGSRWARRGPLRTGPDAPPLANVRSGQAT